MRAALGREVARLARAEQYASLLLHFEQWWLPSLASAPSFEANLGRACYRLMAVTLVVESGEGGEGRHAAPAGFGSHQGRHSRLAIVIGRAELLQVVLVMQLLQTRVLINGRKAAAWLQLAALGPLDVRDLSLLANEGLGRPGLEHDHLVVDVPIVRDHAFRDQRFCRLLLSQIVLTCRIVLSFKGVVSQLGRSHSLLASLLLGSP